MNPYFQEFLQDVIYVIIVFVMPTIVSHLVKAMKAFAEYHANEIQDSEISSAILNAENIVENIVKSLNQTIVEAAKKHNTFNKETQEQVKKEATEMAYDLIADASKSILESTYNSFDKWLDVQIEKSVNENK